MATYNQNERPTANGNGHSQRDPREIQHDIERTRSEMDETINALSERLNPRHLMDVAYDYFRSNTTVSKDDLADGAKSVGKTLAQQIKQHPIPSLLIGAGVMYAMFVEDDDKRRDFHSQWADIPEHSGSFVDARTGEPYNLETYGAEWRQEAAAWRPGYDWSRSGQDEKTWSERAKRSLSQVRAMLGDTSKSARDKMRYVAAHMASLSGHQRDEMHARWANLRSHGGEWVDVRSGESYDPVQARDWEAMMACDYCAAGEWSAEEEASWSEKAQHALDEMQDSLNDATRSAKEQVQALAAKVGEFVGGTREMSAGFARSLSRGASKAGRGINRGARFVSEQARRGSSRVRHQTGKGYDYSRGAMTQGYAKSRDALSQGFNHSRDTVTECIDDYPLAAGAAFVGLGLLLGLAMPRTRYEDRMMGEQSDSVKRYAQEASREAAVRAKHVAQATAAAVVEEAEQQGLTPKAVGEKVQQAAESIRRTVEEQEADKVGASVHTLAEKVERVAERAVATAKDQTKAEIDEMKSSSST
jgi:ElaB/YqjD/DUF883 family membrane-anchored ribosome-binding protein